MALDFSHLCFKNNIIEKLKIDKYVVKIGYINSNNVKKHVLKMKRISKKLKDTELNFSLGGGDNNILFIKVKDTSRLSFYSSLSGWIPFNKIYELSEIYNSLALKQGGLDDNCDYNLYRKSDINNFICELEDEYYNIRINCYYNFNDIDMLTELKNKFEQIRHSLAFTMSSLRSIFNRRLRLICRNAKYLEFIDNIYENNNKILRNIKQKFESNTLNSDDIKIMLSEPLYITIIRELLKNRDIRYTLKEYIISRKNVRKLTKRVTYTQIILGILRITRRDVISNRVAEDSNRLYIGDEYYNNRCNDGDNIQKIEYRKEDAWKQESIQLLKNCLIKFEIEYDSLDCTIYLDKRRELWIDDLIHDKSVSMLLGDSPKDLLFKGSILLIIKQSETDNNKYIVIIRKGLIIGDNVEVT